MSARTITVFEHDRLVLGAGQRKLRERELRALQVFHGEGNHLYYRLLHRGIQLNAHVGILRVGNLTIEVLPKPDRERRISSAPDAEFWRRRLLDMLWIAQELPIHVPTTARLATRPDAILHLYLELFLLEVEKLLRRGIHRAYHEERTNATALSGRLLLTEQFRYNLSRRDRFFVARDHYAFATLHNQLIGMGLRLAARLNRRPALHPRFAALLNEWPVLPDLPLLNETTFDQLTFGRDTDHYRPALSIARLLLLHHHPALRGGRQELLALLFDANRLWEVFLERTLRDQLNEFHVAGQSSRVYWTSERGQQAHLRPDLTIRQGDQVVAVLDAKWKVPATQRPAAEDLQQLYTYAGQLNAKRVGLLYPAIGAGTQVRGVFGEGWGSNSPIVCDALFLPMIGGSNWHRHLVADVIHWVRE